MFSNFKGRQNIYGYYPANVLPQQSYVFLSSLLGEESPKAQVLGAKAINELSTGFDSGNLFESSYYETGMAILQTTIVNERSKEYSVLQEIMRQLGEDFTLKMPDLGNNEEIQQFQADLKTLLESIWSRKGEITRLLINFKGGAYGKAERKTQRFYELLRSELYRTYNDAIKNPMAQDQLMAAVASAMTRNQYTRIDTVIIRAVTRLLGDSTPENGSIQQEFLKMIESDDKEDRQFIDQVIKVFKEPTGLGKVEGKLTLNEELKVQREMEAKRKKLKGKNANKKLRFPLSKYLPKSIEAKGLAWESLDVIVTAALPIIKTVLSTGAMNRKADALVMMGEIHIDLAKIVDGVYKDNPIYDRKDDIGKDPYQFALKLQEGYEKAQKKIQNGLDSFVIHKSSKDYMAETIADQGGFTAGSNGMKLSALTGFLNHIGFVDTSFLIFALNNLSSEALGDQNKESLSNFLAQFIGAFAFDDGLTMYNKQIQDAIPNVRAVHLFALSGQQYPLSTLLQGVYDNIKRGFSQISKPNAGLQGYVRTTITPATGFASKLDALTKSEIFGPSRWQSIRNWSMDKTRIKMNFLKNFSDLVRATKI